MIRGDGNWEFIWTAYKVASGSPMSMGVVEIFSNTFLPTLMHQFLRYPCRNDLRQRSDGVCFYHELG